MVTIVVGGAAAVVTGAIMVALHSLVDVRATHEREKCVRTQARALTDLGVGPGGRDGVALIAALTAALTAGAIRGISLRHGL